MENMLMLVGNIPRSRAGNQLKVDQRVGTTLQIWCFGDLSDDLLNIQQSKIITD
jgi:hypothetical protein